ncbi:MAG: hypothetical protein A2Z93_15800 [Curvibacter sp. GWA2_64_110]|nr:MAG: hypothetical protein A2Z93_15800 [Curvibacter sp. GWA2_64_110]HCY14785.1 DUF2242 domain-containing protein [Curvibacter sp.]
MKQSAKDQPIMKTLCRTLKLNTTLLTLALLAACGTPSVYPDEAFSKESPYFKKFRQSEAQACEAAQHALLSQGYRIERAEAQNVRAKKDFQPDDDVNVTIDFDVVCKASDSGATVFVNAVETTYELKKTSGAASLSVSGGGIALPWGKSTDALVKVAGKTIEDERFYKRFFDLLTTYLGK